MNQLTRIAPETTAPSPPVAPAAIPRLAFPALILGSVALAFGPLFVRWAGVGPTSSAFWRLSLAILPLLLLARVAGQRLPPLRGRLFWVLALAGLFFAADLVAWHFGIERTELANATLFGNVASFAFALYGFAIARRWPGKLASLALLLAGSGTALLLGTSAQLSSRHLAGDLLSVLAGLFYTGYLIAIERVRSQLAPLPTLVLATIFGSFPLLVMSLVSGETFWPHDWTWVLLLALGSQVLGQGLLVYAVGHLTPLVSGLGLLVQPLIAATIGWLWFGETLGPAEIIGALSIVTALVLVRLPEQRPVRDAGV